MLKLCASQSNVCETDVRAGRIIEMRHTHKRTALYARVSTNGQSTESQLRDLRGYAEARGLETIEYIDHGFTGSAPHRPALERLMSDARKRKFDTVLVWRFDRFARSTRHLLTALEEFRSLGIQFISYQENIDTSSALGQALFTSCRPLPSSSVI